MKKSLVVVTAVVAVGGLAVGLYSWSASSKDLPYKTVTVARGEVVEKALAVGSIKPDREIAVKSKISGIVSRSYCEMGDRVRPGDPLFDIIPDPTPLELTEGRREVEIARNTFNQAQKAFERSKALKAQGIVPSQEWEKAEKDIEEARIRLNLANERLALIEKGRVKTDKMAVESVIRAPVAGTVLELLVHEGDPVVPLTSYQAGTPLASIADMNGLLFKGTVDEIDVGKLREGMPARIKVGALPDAQVGGTLEKIAPKSKVEEGATLFEVEIGVQPADGVVLRAGYSANADVIIKEKQGVVLIPERLVTFADGKASVEVPGPDPLQPQKKEIEVGLSDGLNVEVTRGLNQGDLVVERPPRKID